MTISEEIQDIIDDLIDASKLLGELSPPVNTNGFSFMIGRICERLHRIKDEIKLGE